MKKTVIIAIFMLFLGGVIGWFIKGQTLPDTKGDKQETIVQETSGQESDRQETSIQESGKQEIDKQEADVRDADKQETNEQVTYDNLGDDRLLMHESIGRVDYPMIDLYFDKDKEYRVILKDYMTGEIVKEYVDQGDFFQFNKEDFSIITAPSGRGTTPPYLLSIYEGKDCIKEIECMALGNDIMHDKWVAIDSR